jgi:hypothetical protein
LNLITDDDAVIPLIPDQHGWHAYHDDQTIHVTITHTGPRSVRRPSWTDEQFTALHDELY